MRDEFIRFQNYKIRVALQFRVRCVSTFIMINRGVSTERFENIRYYIRKLNIKSTSTCS